MDADTLDSLNDDALLDWRPMPSAQRNEWWERTWLAAIHLADRYRLALRSAWWEDPIQVEALAAFHCWLRLYDTGAETDPTGKLQLLWELERLRAVLRGGEHAFDAARDRVAFERYLSSLDDDGWQQAPGDSDRLRQETANELIAVEERLAELRERQQILEAELSDPLGQGADQRQLRRDLHELRAAIAELTASEHELRWRLDRARHP